MKKTKKQLALAMAAAVTASLFSPAGAVEAASKPAWKSTKVSLVKGKSANFTLKNISSGYKTTFTSSNKKIVKVKKVNNKKVKITAVKAGTATVKAVVKNKKGKKVKTLTKKVKVTNPTVKVTTKPTATVSTTTQPTATPYVDTAKLVKISGKNVTVKSVSGINNTDFTFTVTATLADGTKLSDLVPSAVKTALTGTKITLTGEENKIVLTATYSDYSSDKDSIIYKIDNASVLQPSKNNGDVGSANGSYKLASDSFIFAGDLFSSYYEALVGNSVSGYIYAKNTKLPLKNATVTAYTSDSTKTVKTDSNGFYELPLTSGTYTISAQAEDSTKYFISNANGKVNTNNKTACNMYIDTYNREELFITGTVRSDVNNGTLENAVVTLYEVNNGVEKKVASVKTGANGMYTFKNKGAADTDDYKEFLEVNNVAEKDISVKTFDYNKGLNRGITYKLVISKEFSKSNLTNAHETTEIKDVVLGDSRQKDIGNTVLRGIKQIKNYDISAKWNCDLPELGTDKTVETTVKFCMLVDGKYVPIVSKKVKLEVDSNTKEAEKYVLTENNFFAKEYPTIPSGRYYMLLDDGNSTKSAIAVEAVDISEGSSVSVDFKVNAGKSTSVGTNCSIMNSVSKKNYKNGSPVYVVSDTEGNLLTSDGKNVEVQPVYSYYRKIGNDLVFLSTVKAELKYYETGSLFNISASTGIARTETDCDYVVIPAQSYIYGEDSVSFTQSNQEMSAITYSCAGAANINYVKIKSLSQIKTSDTVTLKESSKLNIDYVALYDADKNTKIAQYDCEDVSYTVKDLISTGVAIPDTETGFKGLKPSSLADGTGKYKVVLKIADYDAVDTTVAVTDFQSVEVTQTSNINYTQKTTLTGSLTIGGSVDAQDSDVSTVDALLILYDKNGTIVGAQTYGNKKDVRKYAFVNGENAYLEEDGEYTLVVRGIHHNSDISFETYVEKITITSGEKVDHNISLQKGSNGSVTISATDEKNNYLENGNVTLYDENYVNLLTVEYVAGYDILKTLTTVDPSLIGIYNIPKNEKSSKEWVANQCIPKGNYKAVITSDRTQLYTIDAITISSGQHWTKTDILIPLMGSENEVKLTLKYAHQLEKNKKSPFEMCVVYDESGNIVAQKVVFDTLANTDELSYNTVNVFIPNVPGTYSVVVYSTGSFLNRDTVPVQGIDKELEVKLVKSDVVG